MFERLRLLRRDRRTEMELEKERREVESYLDRQPPIGGGDGF